MQRRREAQEKMALEQKAALGIRKVIQKMRAVGADEFEVVNAELEQVLQQELPNVGAQMEQLRNEAHQMRAMAQQRIETEKEAKRQEEERQKELERIRLEQEAARKEFLAKLGSQVDALEKQCTALKEAAASADGGDGDDTSADAAAAAAAAVRGDAGAAAKAACQACKDLLVANRANVEALRQMSETKDDMIGMQARIHKGFEDINATIEKATAAHEKILRKAHAMSVLRKRTAVFEKYITHKQKGFAKAEIKKYAKGECGFDLSDEAATKIFQRLADASGHIPQERFQPLKLAVFIAKEEEASRIRRKEAEERRKQLEAQKAALQDDFDKIGRAADAVESAVAKAEELCNTLATTLGEETSALEPVDAAQAQIDTAREATEAVRAQITKLVDAVDGELQGFVQAETSKYGAQAGACEARLGRSVSSLQEVRGHRTRRAAAELEKLRAGVVKLMKDYISEKKVEPEEFFKLVDKDEDGSISRSEFLSFLQGLDSCEIEADKLDRLFSHLCETVMAKETFLRLVAVRYRVVKDSIVQTEMAVASKENKTVRRLDEAELVEVYAGPVKDDKGITRVKCCAVKDGAVGWVTVVGNNGIIFLEEEPAAATDAQPAAEAVAAPVAPAPPPPPPIAAATEASDEPTGAPQPGAKADQ